MLALIEKHLCLFCTESLDVLAKKDFGVSLHEMKTDQQRKRARDIILAEYGKPCLEFCWCEEGSSFICLDCLKKKVKAFEKALEKWDDNAK